MEAGIAFNSPLLLHAVTATASPASTLPIFTVTPLSPGCLPILDTVKLAECDDGSIILRFYEALGGRGAFTLASYVICRFCVCLASSQRYWFSVACRTRLREVSSAKVVNLLEAPMDDAPVVEIVGGSTFTLDIQPFQILSVAVRVC